MQKCAIVFVEKKRGRRPATRCVAWAPAYSFTRWRRRRDWPIHTACDDRPRTADSPPIVPTRLPSPPTSTTGTPSGAATGTRARACLGPRAGRGSTSRGPWAGRRSTSRGPWAGRRSACLRSWTWRRSACRGPRAGRRSACLGPWAGRRSTCLGPRAGSGPTDVGALRPAYIRPSRIGSCVGTAHVGPSVRP